MKLMFGSLALGVPLMLLFEHPFTRIAGVILCFTFIVSGVFVLAHPDFLGQDLSSGKSDSENPPP